MKMKTLTFETFANSEDDFIYVPIYNDRKLYVVRNGNAFMYIGISETCIWERWFSQRKSHMFITHSLNLVGRSNIGAVVQENLPESLSWSIDLWAMPDLLDFLEVSYTYENEQYHIDDERYWFKWCKVKHLEEVMIKYLCPKVNIMGNNWTEPNEYFLNKYLTTLGVS